MFRIYSQKLHSLFTTHISSINVYVQQCTLISYSFDEYNLSKCKYLAYEIKFYMRYCRKHFMNTCADDNSDR